MNNTDVGIKKTKELACKLCEEAGDFPLRIIGKYEMADGRIQTFYAWEYYRHKATLMLFDCNYENSISKS